MGEMPETASPEAAAKALRLGDICKPAPICIEACVEAFVEALLKTNKEGRCHIDQIFRFAELRGERPEERGDVLTINLMGFPPDDLPRLTHNFCNSMGKIFQDLLSILYRAAYPDLLTTDMKELKKAVEKIQERGEKVKWAPDLLLALIAIEIKYRCGNGQGMTEQKRGAELLKKLGKLPVMILLRNSPNTSAFKKGGWDASEGQEAIDRINAECGVDFIEIIRLAGQDSRVIACRERNHRDMMLREGRRAKYLLETYADQMAAAEAS